MVATRTGHQEDTGYLSKIRMQAARFDGSDGPKETLLMDQTKNRDISNSTSIGAERLAYSVSEAASVTGLGRTTLFALIRDGRLPSRKICNRRLIRKADLEQLLCQPNGVTGI